MKIVLGAYARAKSNKHRTMRSLSPRHLDAKVADDTLKKVVPHSVATAFAKSVFPVPGGPNINTPFHGRLIPCTFPLMHNVQGLVHETLNPLKGKI
jgi:hypothetical protein